MLRACYEQEHRRHQNNYTQQTSMCMKIMQQRQGMHRAEHQPSHRLLGVKIQNKAIKHAHRLTAYTRKQTCRHNTQNCSSTPNRHIAGRQTTSGIFQGGSHHRGQMPTEERGYNKWTDRTVTQTQHTRSSHHRRAWGINQPKVHVGCILNGERAASNARRGG